MQITPSTASLIARESGGTQFTQADLATPQVNIAYGSYYLRYLLDRYEGNEELAVAAYNAGPTRVDEWVATPAAWTTSRPTSTSASRRRAPTWRTCSSARASTARTTRTSSGSRRFARNGGGNTVPMSRRGALAMLTGALAMLGAGTPVASGHEVRTVTKGAVFMQGMQADPFTEGQPIDQPARDAALRGPAGPCTEATANGMPEGAGHDHQDPAQHRTLACRIEQLSSDSLKDELTDSGFPENAVLGEMDVKADIAAIAVTYPVAGILFFDVSDPAAPEFVSAYKGRACDAQPIDINCGAFADLSTDGTVAFLSVQNLSSLPGQPDVPGTPGIEVIDISDLENPTLTQPYAGATGLTGVHTSRAHTIPASGGAGPRAPGEYVFANRNSVGVTITQLIEVAGLPQLVPVGEIEAPDLHDTFVQEDPSTDRTYLYLADGYGSGFQIYDVTDPAAPEKLGQWDLTPECSADWYSHTIDVTTNAGKRYVTLPVELFDGGEASASDKAEGCNATDGSSNRAGPMWIVDATDPASLAQSGDSEEEEKQKSEAALVTTWTNPGGCAGGNLNFSPHNQQIVGNKIYLSNYHGGVIVLDATSAFDGISETSDSERPSEIGFMVPEVGETRPIFGPISPAPVSPFFTDFPLGRPHVWDMVVYDGVILTQDMTGGLYSLRETNGATPNPPAGGPCGLRSAAAGGSSGSQTSQSASTPAPAAARARCSSPRGRLRPRNIGVARLGRRRAAQRRGFVRAARRRVLVDRFCLTDGTYIRVGYASRAATRSGAKPRPRLRGKTIIVLTASKRYIIRGVNAGDPVGAMRRAIKGLSRPYRIGANAWYLAKGSSSRLVFRVRGGQVREIGVADLGVTSQRKPTRRLLRLFDTG